eukprot:1294627-Ditylum_brightwellii.AAC.1
MKWMPFVPDTVVVKDLKNIFDCRAPKVPEEEAESIPTKHNFNKTFQQNNFEGTFHAVKRRSNGKVKRDQRGMFDKKSTSSQWESQL